MEEVVEEEVGEVVQPEHGGGGKEGLLRHPEHGQGDDAADEEGEDCPVVQQGGGLLEGEEIAAVPLTKENSVLRSQGYTFQTWPSCHQDMCQSSNVEPAILEWRISTGDE